ncbi:MAG TPA: zinc metallopeptidase [Firmicutes bacterium]|nr:zinc metallopeptidase [Bacillota bacterium]
MYPYGGFGFYFDWTYILLIPAFILSMWAQFKVSSTFSKYSKVSNRRGMTGADAARYILDINGLRHVRIERINGNLTDHFDPRSNVVRLSDSTYASTSVGAIGVAAHECGHAVQYATDYAPIRIRNAIVPVVNICSKLSIPIIIIGFIFAYAGSFSNTLLNIGIILFSATVFFQLITLPVEFNASNRAIATLEQRALLQDDELKGAKKVLSAAAMTYVAAAFSAIMSLLRLIIIARNSDRD